MKIMKMFPRQHAGKRKEYNDSVNIFSSVVETTEHSETVCSPTAVMLSVASSVAFEHVMISCSVLKRTVSCREM